jgi:hypothetical protein
MNAEEGVIYKVLFLGTHHFQFRSQYAPTDSSGRHGQGWHNYAVELYGEEVCLPSTALLDDLD